MPPFTEGLLPTKGQQAEKGGAMSKEKTMSHEKSTGVPLKSGDEYDMLTKARKYHAPRAGKAKAVKNFYIKRVRREAKKKLRSESEA
jgi:hypothetical protein